MDDLFAQFRYFLKDNIRQKINFRLTDQSLGKLPPPIEKNFSTDKERINLIKKDSWQNISNIGIISAIENRKSYRQFKPSELSLEELSFLLWATQGVRKVTKDGTVYRTVPSAGCRHAFETYLCIMSVEGLKKGIYRYLPIEHQLVFEKEYENVSSAIIEATFNQSFTGKCAVTFIWTAIPYRMEWRYHLAAHKVIAIDVGHVCQNLYLASAAINGGCCAVGAYHQELVDKLIGVDGEDEFTIYLAAVGKV